MSVHAERLAVPGRAGFASVRIERLGADLLNDYYYATKGTLS